MLVLTLIFAVFHGTLSLICAFLPLHRLITAHSDVKKLFVLFCLSLSKKKAVCLFI